MTSDNLRTLQLATVSARNAMTAVETPRDSFRRLVTSPILQGLVVLVLAVLVSVSMQASGRFPDPDAFYHAGMAELAREGTFPTSFPWLALTTLRDTYADLHFVYHLVLVPFAAAFGTMEGLRIATIASVGLLAVAFFALLRVLRVRGALWATVLLLGSAAFMFRVNLAKAQGFAFLALFLGMAAAARQSRIGVFIAAVFAAWLSGHWPVLLVAVAAFAFADVFTTAIAHGSSGHAILSAIGRGAALVGAAAAGVAVAHVVSPYFPENLTVGRQQIVDIALLGIAPDVRPGVEWSALPALEFFGAIGYLLPLAALAIAGAVMLLARTARAGGGDDRRAAASAMALGFLAFAFTLLTLRSRRHIEYFTPFAILAIVVGIQPIVAWCWPPRIAVGWRRPGTIRRTVSSLAFTVCVIGFVAGAWRAHVDQRSSFERGYRADFLAGPAAYLREHVPAGERIFHASWDDFPFLFRLDRTHTYLVGIDPRYGALDDAARMRALTEIATTPGDAVASRIVREFDARTAVVLADETALRAALDRDPRATRVFTDDDGAVYTLAP